MKKNILLVALLVASTYLTGCASVPMGTPEDDAARKKFTPPSSGMSGLYIYRNSNFGSALKKSIYVDGNFIGESAPMTYFYKEVKPGKHKLSTESEFSENHLSIFTKPNRNYFFRQYIKFGVFVGGANIEPKTEDVGRRGVLECKLAKELKSKPIAKNEDL